MRVADAAAGPRPRARPRAAAPSRPRSGRAGWGFEAPIAGAAVLEDLDPAVASAELRGLRRPQVDRRARTSAGRHPAEGQVVARREAQDPAGAAARPRPAGGPSLEPSVGRVRAQGREVVREDERALVRGVDVAVAPACCRGTGSRSGRTSAAGRRAATPSRPCHGRRVRPAETSTHSSMSGL